MSGVLAGRNAIGWSFVAAGILKASYDLGILAVFKGHTTREERMVVEEGDGQGERREDE